MTDEQINAAIAEACGWTELEECSCGFKQRGNPPERSAHKKHIPNYCADLNAMHEAEKMIYRGIKDQQYWQRGYGRFRTILSEISCEPYSATARQRAEAFLRTLGKWEEVWG